MNEVLKKLEDLESEIKPLKSANSLYEKETQALKNENTRLKNQLGIRPYLKKTPAQTPARNEMETDQSSIENNTAKKKPPPSS
jgi:regulator of replication initiation timing